MATDQAKITLILHSGTPKTGTTTIQHYLDQSHDLLIDRGILYPRVDLMKRPPKHQWIVKSLLNRDHDCLFGRFGEILAQARETRVNTVVLSTEGIYTHWRNFSNEALDALLQAVSPFNVKPWCFFREPVAFAKSRYVQLVRNPPSSFSPEYATVSPFEEIIKHPWFIQQLDYAGFLKAMERLFGEESMIVTRYEPDDVLRTVNRVLSLQNDISEKFARKHVSISTVATNAIRHMNRLKLRPRVRSLATSIVSALDSSWLKTRYPFEISHDVEEALRAITKESVEYLAARYGIRWR